MPPLTLEDTTDIIGPLAAGHDPHDAEYLARTVQALADGQPVTCGPSPTSSARCATTVAGSAGRAAIRSAPSPALLAPDGRLAQAVRLLLRAAAAPCARLRRAQSDSRHPGRRRTGSRSPRLRSASSARLVRRRTTCRGSRTSISSPRGRSATASPIRCSASGCGCTAAPAAPTEDDVAREIHRYALPRLPQPANAPALALATAGGGAADDDKKSWGIIEID